MHVYVRWVPRPFAVAARDAGFRAHEEKIALWIFDLSKSYRPGGRISTGSILIAYELDDTAHQNITSVNLIDFESERFGGEAAHPNDVIFKSNEPGAYGIGSGRQKTTNYHVKVRYATKDEVRKALTLRDVKEVTDAYRPQPGWGR